ncbi:PREDICTED: uncharacterized protein LOC104816611 [Tarenaya hassleriana]|uniref:uncharacterized protein LOC104816611 n=1 Tax=Tarenaya hassleriana TaxID=28532 RepID=UPI00053C6C0B|nr:PREDICTED: uncharacterized protein LOC104816611 [Tarenaya hassleriana]
METPPSLRRRNSIAATVATPFPIASSSPPSTLDLELTSLKSCSSFVAYTSLRDLISSPTASIYSPVANGGGPVGEISIRNRLVKQAAWSYLQPTAIASSPGPYGSQLLQRVWVHFSAGLRFLSRMVDWIFGSIRNPLAVKELFR